MEAALKALHADLNHEIDSLATFNGLETELADLHGNLRDKFVDYRGKIDSMPCSASERQGQMQQHDELVKKMHKMLLTARQFARKRAAQLSREELFQRSQERQHRLQQAASLSPEDRIGEEVTVSLKRMLETMRGEVERSANNIQTANDTSGKLKGTTGNYQAIAGNLGESRKLVRDLKKKDRRDRWVVISAVGLFMGIAGWIFMRRIGLDSVIKAPLTALRHNLFVPRAGVNDAVEKIQLQPHPGPEHEIEPIFFENLHHKDDSQPIFEPITSQHTANDENQTSPLQDTEKKPADSVRKDSFSDSNTHDSQHFHHDPLIKTEDNSGTDLSEGELSDTDSDHERVHPSHDTKYDAMAADEESNQTEPVLEDTVEVEQQPQPSVADKAEEASGIRDNNSAEISKPEPLFQLDVEPPPPVTDSSAQAQQPSSEPEIIKPISNITVQDGAVNNDSAAQPILIYKHEKLTNSTRDQDDNDAGYYLTPSSSSSEYDNTTSNSDRDEL